MPTARPESDGWAPALEIVQGHCRWRCTNNSNNLGRCLQLEMKNMRPRKDFFMFWQEPLLFAMCQLWFQIGLCMYGIVQLSLSICSAVGASRYGVVRSSVFVLLIQSIDLSPPNSSLRKDVLEFSVLYDGCPLEKPFQDLVFSRESSLTITRSYSESVEINGFYLRMNSTESPFSSFVLQACPGGNSSCFSVASPRVRLTEWGPRVIPANLDLIRGQRELWQLLSAPWPLLVRSIGIRAVAGLACLTAVAVEWTGNIDSLPNTVAAGLSFVAVGNVLAAIGYWALGFTWEPVHLAANVVVLLGLIPTLRTAKRVAGLACFVGAGVVLCCQVATACGALDGCGGLREELAYGWVLVFMLSGAGLVGGLSEAWSVACEGCIEVLALDHRWRALLLEDPLNNRISRLDELKTLVHDARKKLCRHVQPSGSNRSQELSQEESKICSRFLGQVVACGSGSQDPANPAPAPSHDLADGLSFTRVSSASSYREGQRSVRNPLWPQIFRARLVDRRLSLTSFRNSLTSFGSSFSEVNDADSSLRGREAVESLDQLYSQAVVACLALRRKGGEWAARCGGTVHVHSELPEELLNAEEACATESCDSTQTSQLKGFSLTWSREPSASDSGVAGEQKVEPYLSLADMVRRGWVKHPRHAAGKALACFGGDVSKVVDICRIRLCFDTLDDIVQCALTIASDVHVEVVRLSNTLGARRSSSWKTVSAGFLGVVLNLRFRRPEAVAMGFERHVCEVQLVLKAFDVIEDLESRRRYFRFRNARATGLVSMMMPLARWYNRHTWCPPPSLPADQHRGAVVVGVDSVFVPNSVFQPLEQEHQEADDRGPSADLTALNSVRIVRTECPVLPHSAKFEVAAAVRSASIIARRLEEATRASSTPNDPIPGSPMPCPKRQSSERGPMMLSHLLEPEDRWSTHGNEIKNSIELYRRCTLFGSPHDGRWYQDSMISTTSILFTRTPMTSAWSTGSSKPFFAALLLGIGAYIIVWFAQSIQIVIQRGSFLPAPRSLRIRVLGLRNASLDVSTGNNITFGGLNNGCPLTSAAGTRLVSSGNGSSPALLSFAQPADINGYYFDIDSGPVNADPVRWIVEGSGEVGVPTSWKPFGASSWFAQSNVLELFPSMAFDTPSSRPARVLVDNRPSIAWIVCNPIGRGLTAWLWMGCPFFGVLLGSPWHAKYSLLGAFMLSGLCEGMSAVLYNLTGRWRDAVYMWLYALIDVAFSTCGYLSEKRFFNNMFFLGLISPFIQVVKSSVLYPTPSVDLERLLTTKGLMALALTTVILMLRHVTLRRARRLVLVDKVKYDAIWTVILANEEERAQLELMTQDVDRYRLCQAMVPRQLSREFPRGHRRKRIPAMGKSLVFCRLPRGCAPWSPEGPADWDRCLSSGAPLTVDPHRPVDSLDQLLFQAQALRPIFITKVQDWAKSSGGWFRGLEEGPDGGFVQWTASSDEEREALAARVKWCGVKSAERSAEKANRAYGKDVSYLVDLCRQSIYFSSVEGVRRCLQEMASDVDVLLLRIKNRMDPGFDAALSAGFRSVSVNLRVVSDKAQALGVEGHVAEVQLLLMSMADIKEMDDEGAGAPQE